MSDKPTSTHGEQAMSDKQTSTTKPAISYTKDEHGQTIVRPAGVRPAELPPPPRNSKAPDAIPEVSPEPYMGGVPLRDEERIKVNDFMTELAMAGYDDGLKVVARLLDAYDVVAEEALTRAGENADLLNRMVRDPNPIPPAPGFFEPPPNPLHRRKRETTAADAEIIAELERRLLPDAEQMMPKYSELPAVRKPGGRRRLARAYRDLFDLHHNIFPQWIDDILDTDEH